MDIKMSYPSDCITVFRRESLPLFGELMSTCSTKVKFDNTVNVMTLLYYKHITEKLYQLCIPSGEGKNAIWVNKINKNIRKVICFAHVKFGIHEKK